MSEIELPGGNSPFVNSDILIKALVKKNKKSILKLRRELRKINLKNNERLLISDYVLNDVLIAAQSRGMPLSEILMMIYEPSGYGFPFIVGSNFRNSAARDKEFLKAHCLTLTDWTILLIMVGLGNKILITDKKEIDDILDHKDFKEMFHGIRTV